MKSRKTTTRHAHMRQVKSGKITPVVQHPMKYWGVKFTGFDGKKKIISVKSKEEANKFLKYVQDVKPDAKVISVTRKSIDRDSDGDGVPDSVDCEPFNPKEQDSEPLEGMRKHKLMPIEVRKKIPKLYAQEEVEDKIVYVKFFTPYSDWTWYATEFDGDDRFFGLVDGIEKEWGYFSLQEMAETTSAPFGKTKLPAVERDMYFDPTPISKIKLKIR